MAREKTQKEAAGKELMPLRPVFEMSPFREIERFFEDVRRRAFWPWAEFAMEPIGAPSVDIYEEGEDIVLKAEIPGIKKEELDVNITDNTVTISGEKKKEEKVEKKDYYRVERSYGSFSRSIPLPAEVQTDKSTAKFKDGILEIRIPKTEEAKKKKRRLKIE